MAAQKRDKRLRGKNAELTAANERLVRGEDRFRILVDAVEDYAIFMLDPTGHVASWNEGARRLKGYEEGEILGEHFSKFYPPEDVAAGKLEKELAVALAFGRVEDEGWRVRKDGTRFWANVVITCVHGPDAELLGYAKVTRDLTERRRAEEALRLANESLEARVLERTRELERALRVRDDFLSIASHELKTPLTSLKLHLQLGARRLQKASSPELAAAQNAVSRSLEQAVTLEELVEDLLDVARVQSGRFELVRAKVAVAKLIEETASRFGLQLAEAQMPLTLELDPTLTAEWDARRIGQVLSNLVANAIKYAPRGALKLTAAPAAGGRARLCVSDWGPGIAKERHAAIFERFERGDAPQTVAGLGLGLFISRRIVEAHGGSLRLESELGRGATFWVELPLRPPPEAEVRLS